MEPGPRIEREFMPNCQDFEPLVTAWLDDVATAEQRRQVESHLSGCRCCRQRAEAERSARELLRTRAPQVLRSDAPPDLEARCRALCAVQSRLSASETALRSRPIRFSIAAVIALAVGGVLIYGVTASSTTTLAAQLTLDHVKCFVLTRESGAPVTPETVRAQLQERYGWTVDVPGDSEANALHLVGGRRCLYGQGTIAHILYRHRGAPLSLFMLPDTVRASEIVAVMGHEAIIWAHNRRTFVLLGSESREQMQEVAEYLRSVVR